jgi:hypothetical protein
VTFSEWFVNKCREENDSVQHLITSDESHFHLSGCVNKQNFRSWGKENHKSYINALAQCQGHSVVCSDSCMIGPYFFKDEHGTAIAVNC